jgi:hypothetical protein
MKVWDSILMKEGKGLSIQQSDDTRRLFAYLMTTCKNVSIYPEDHSISINSIRQFYETLEAYIREYGDVRIEIEKDRVICQGVEVHKGAFKEGTLPFTLFRDGIQWLEFTEGINPEEIRKILSIIQRYSVLTVEPQGDIVTDFWEACFNHVLYNKIDDFFSEQAPDQTDDFSKSDTMPIAVETEAEDERTSPGALTIDPAAVALTPQELVERQKMVFDEEEAPATEYLNMLLDMIMQHQEEKDFNIVLEILHEEYEGSFSRHDFEAALIILDGVRKVLDTGKLSAPWMSLLLESFYKDISSDSDCLKSLQEIWNKLDVQQVETIRRIFQHLNPSIVNAIVHLLPLEQPTQLKKIVEDTITSLVTQDVSCLESLINDSNERIAEKLVPVLSRLEGDASLKYLMKLARHSSASVRRMAVKAIGQARDSQISTIFKFINDPDDSVRRVILTQMGQSRNEIAEDFMIKYLQTQKFGASQTKYIMECFKTLGECGSLRSVPFLSKTLLDRKWMADFRKSAYRKGAALALVALKIPEARQVIESAGRSFHPGLRRIARKAGREFFQKNRGGR